jgi:hypothetical protein
MWYFNSFIWNNFQLLFQYNFPDVENRLMNSYILL